MKLIDDYTKEEILKLEHDDIERVVKLHLANEGIKIPKVPVEPKYNEVPEMDKTIYSIKGLTMCFEKQEAANEVVKLLRNNFSTLRKMSYNYDIGSDYYYDEPYNGEDYDYQHKGIESLYVIEKRVYSTELYVQIKEKLNQNKQLLTAYNKEKEEYDKISTTAKKTIDYIWDKVNEIVEEQAEKDRKLAQFKEYLDLADGKIDVAWKFMKKAYSVSKEEEDYVNANLVKDTGF